MTKLSDIVIKASDDVLHNIFKTEFVHKFLMTGELTDRNRTAGQRFYKDLHDMEKPLMTLFHDVLKITALTTEEHEFFAGLVEKYDKQLEKVMHEVKHLVGPVPNELLHSPIHKPVDHYLTVLKDVVAKGSVVNILVGFMTEYHIDMAVYNYLVHNPHYKENHLAKVFLFQTIGNDSGFSAIKHLIDTRVHDVDHDLEKQLIHTYRELAELALKGIDEYYH